jgi:hypothetical protein
MRRMNRALKPTVAQLIEDPDFDRYPARQLSNLKCCSDAGLHALCIR